MSPRRLTAKPTLAQLLVVGVVVLLGGGAVAWQQIASTDEPKVIANQGSATTAALAVPALTTAVSAPKPSTTASPAAVTKDELLNFYLPPGACSELSPGPHRLTSGTFSEQPAGQPYPQGIKVKDVVLGDLDSDGVGDGAFSFGCDYAGTFHITDVYAVRAADRQALNVKLVVEHPEWSAFDARQEALNDVRSLTITGQRLRVHMEWRFQTEPTAGGSTVASGTYRFQPPGFVREAMSVTSDLTRTVELTAALNARDRARVSRMTAHRDFMDGFNYEMDHAERFEFQGCPMPAPLTEPPTCLIQSVRGYGEGESGDPLNIRWVGSPDARRAQTA